MDVTIYSEYVSYCIAIGAGGITIGMLIAFLYLSRRDRRRRDALERRQAHLRMNLRRMNIGQGNKPHNKAASNIR